MGLHAEVTARLRAAGCVFAEDEADLLLAAVGPNGDAPDGDPDRLEELVRRRVAGEPLEHVVGRVSFCGRDYLVDPGVFVPRARSEHLVACALDHASRQTTGAERPLVVLDLCCGCGALGLALAAGLDPGSVELHAADLDPRATANARRNVDDAAWLVSADVHTGDLFAPLPADLRGRVDVLLVNVPYVPTAELALMPREARDFEPATALDGGVDGLAVLRRVASQASHWLARDGALFTETGQEQAVLAVDVLQQNGLRAGEHHDEDEDGWVSTVVVGVSPRG